MGIIVGCASDDLHPWQLLTESGWVSSGWETTGRCLWVRMEVGMYSKSGSKEPGFETMRLQCFRRTEATTACCFVLQPYICMTNLLHMKLSDGNYTVAFGENSSPRIYRQQFPRHTRSSVLVSFQGKGPTAIVTNPATPHRCGRMVTRWK